MLIAGVSKLSFFTHHTAMHDLMKGNFVPSQLHASCEQLSRKFYDRMISMVTDGNEVKVELLTLVKSIMFPSVVSHLFGDDILPEGKVCHDVSTALVTTVSSTCRNQCLNFRNVSSNMIKILSMEQNYQNYL